jgi:hypothetical protein
MIREERSISNEIEGSIVATSSNNAGFRFVVFLDWGRWVHYQQFSRILG